MPRKPIWCPVCEENKDIHFMGPYTVTLSCGAVCFTGTPDEDSTLWTKWYSFDKHEKGA